MKKILLTIFTLSFALAQFSTVAPKTGMIKNSGFGIWIQGQQYIEDTDADPITGFAVDYVINNNWEVSLGYSKVEDEDITSFQGIYYMRSKNLFIDLSYSSFDREYLEVDFINGEIVFITYEGETTITGVGAGWNYKGMFITMSRMQSELCTSDFGATVCIEYDPVNLVTLGKMFKLSNNLFFGTSYRASTEEMTEGYIGLSIGMSL